MTTSEWRISLRLQGLDPASGTEVPVVVGLIDTAAGGVQVALQVGDGRPVILPLQVADQLGQNVTEATAARLRLTVDKLGDE